MEVFRGTVAISDYMFTNEAVPNWAFDWSLQLVSVQLGNPLGLSISNARVQCVGMGSNDWPCGVSSGGDGIPSQPLVPNVAARGVWYMTSPDELSTPGIIMNHFVQARVQFNYAYPNTPPLDWPDIGQRIRCDNALPGYALSGCTFPYRPYLAYSQATFPELTAHIASAQAAGAPGSDTLPPKVPLNRLTNTALADKNRNTACPPAVPRPPGKSCDEYPFRSTWQGHYTRRGGYPVSARMIDQDENSLGGTDLGTFYRENRVIENDAFWVWITP
ncbi:NucA/NucB deoxyribonuclease domain-containing protein [Asanoa siamensis]|uniref:NucA/NucB deoxyribonuclease domain-containing protein n=1 Tax=Asanoa siamensis TaxID=926357 RepID=UPI0019447D0E|nr:hypothetical protein [Asanoa siamensis]